MEANRAAIDEAGLALVVTLPETPVWMSVDPTRLVQVLSNLLNNATKFTDTGGTVVVNAEVGHDAAADSLRLSVTDNGIGISRAMLPRVFELFAQAEHDGHRPQPGLGIGLSLARRIVELHDGEITAHSEGAGTGSTFTIRLPLMAPESVAPVYAHPDVDRAVTVRRVLIIDDNHDAAEMMAALVRSMGAEAETAADGLDGIDRVATFEPDMILLDIGMPGLDGYDTCRRIRRENGRHTLIVALTGWGQDRDKARAAEAGFDAHLTKPADPEDIQRLMSSGRGAS